MYLLLLFSLCLWLGDCRNSITTADQTVPNLTINDESTINICVLPPPDDHTTMIPIENLPRIEKIQFFNSGKIWLFTGYQSYEIYQSKDSGKSWTKLQIENTAYFHTFYFLDENNGWAADWRNNIWKTTDSGKNWVKSSPFGKVINTEIEQIEFTTPQVGWLRDIFNIYLTENGGISWKKIWKLSDQPYEMFISGNNGWITFGKDDETSPLRMLITSNNGKTWSTSIINGHNSIKSIFFIDAKTGWLSNSFYGLFKSNDAGRNWFKVKLDEKDFQTNSIFWLDFQHGWLAGAVIDPDKPISAPTIPTLLYTTNSGQTWDKFEITSDERFFNQVYFTDVAHGWLASKNKLYKTENGGKSWSSVLKINVETKQKCN